MLAMGTVAGAAVDAADTLAAEGIRVSVALVSCPLDLDEETMSRLCASAPLVLTVEDHHVRSGLGASVAEWLALSGVSVPFLRLGVEGYQSSGTAKDLLAAAGLDAAGIAQTLRLSLKV
jgi:transketolase